MNYVVATNLTVIVGDMGPDIAYQRRFFNQIKQALKIGGTRNCMHGAAKISPGGSTRRNPAQSANSSVVVVDLLNR